MTTFDTVLKAARFLIEKRPNQFFPFLPLYRNNKLYCKINAKITSTVTITLFKVLNTA